MNKNDNPTNLPNVVRATSVSRASRGEVLALLDRLRQDQLDAALAGHLAESAFYATEAKLLRRELDGQKSLFICA
jgi:hypothetical protein